MFLASETWRVYWELDLSDTKTPRHNDAGAFSRTGLFGLHDL